MVKPISVNPVVQTGLGGWMSGVIPRGFSLPSHNTGLRGQMVSGVWHPEMDVINLNISEKRGVWSLIRSPRRSETLGVLKHWVTSAFTRMSPVGQSA